MEIDYESYPASGRRNAFADRLASDGRARRCHTRRARLPRLRCVSLARTQSQHGRPEPSGNLEPSVGVAYELRALLSRTSNQLASSGTTTRSTNGSRTRSTSYQETR